MPIRVQAFCREPGCGKRCAGGFCADHTRSDPRRRFDELRGSAANRGYGRRHERLRKLVLARDPICMIHRPMICLMISTVADHRIPKSRGGTDAMENMQGACEPCHDWKTATQDSSFVQRKK
jgi:5-methylcytosine-specific restriction protein A